MRFWTFRVSLDSNSSDYSYCARRKCRYKTGVQFERGPQASVSASNWAAISSLWLVNTRRAPAGNIQSAKQILGLTSDRKRRVFHPYLPASLPWASKACGGHSLTCRKHRISPSIVFLKVLRGCASQSSSLLTQSTEWVNIPHISAASAASALWAFDNWLTRSPV